MTVEQAGSVVHEAEFGLGPSQPREYGGDDDPTGRISCTWSGRGPFTVRSEMDGDRTETVRLDAPDNTEEGDSRQGTRRVQVRGDGELVGVGLVEDDTPVSDACRRSPSSD